MDFDWYSFVDSTLWTIASEQDKAQARSREQEQMGGQKKDDQQRRTQEREKERQAESTGHQQRETGKSSEKSESDTWKKSGKIHSAKRPHKPFAVIKIHEETPRLGRPLWSMNLKLFGIALQTKRLFPKLHRRNPLSKVKLPALIVTANRDPLGLKRLITIPLNRQRSRARRKIMEVVKALFSAGLKSIFMIQATTDSPGDPSENWNPRMRKRTRPRVAIAKTPSRIWRQLIKDWAADGLNHAEDNPILTATRAKAEVLNRIAQQMRQRSAKIGVNGVKMGKCVFHDNDRILFPCGHKKYGIESNDLGTVLGVSSKQISVLLDHGKKVAVELKDCPEVMLGYALCHEDAAKVKSPRARILYEGRHPTKEMAEINKHHAQRKLLVYTTKENAADFTSWGQARLRDRFIDEAWSQRAREQAFRAKQVEAEKRRAEEDRRREEKRRQREENLRQQRQKKSEQQSQSKSHGHSH